MRNLIREYNLHQLENIMQMGARDGMMLMDDSLHQLYARCEISYDTALTHAREPDKIKSRISKP